MKQWIRWSGLLGFIAIIALLVVGWMFVAGPLIKYSIETFGSKAANAKVEVEDVSLSFAPMGIEITGLQVANADKPMENIFQFDRAVADLEFLPLLLGKGIVNEVVLSGVAFSTPRQSSGALLDDRDDDAEKTSSAKNESFINPDSINQALPSADELLAREPLLTEQRGRAFQQSFKTIKTDSDNAIAALPGNEDFAAYEDEFNRLTSGKFDSVEDFQQRKKEFDALKKRIKQDQKAISKAKEVLTAGKESLTQQWADLKVAPAEDFKNLKRKYKLDGAGVTNLSRLMFGDAAGEWSEKGVYWYEKIRPFLISEESDVRSEKADVEHIRQEGRFVHFESDRPLPDLLIRQMYLRVKLPETNAQSMGDVAVTVYDITHQQAVINRPTRIVATGKNLNNIQSLDINGTLDHRSSPGKDSLQMKIKGVNLTDYNVGAMGLKLNSSLVDITGEADIVAGDVDATSKAQFSKAVFSSKDKTLVAKELVRALQKIDRFDIDASAEGSLIAPKVGISSDLDRKLNNAFSQRIDEKQQELEQQLKGKLNDKLLAYGGDYQQQLKALDIQNGSLTDKQNTLKELAKSELSSFEDQKKKELEKKAKDKFKNLF
tara:strand:+ start:4083 stop:5891 length:1809 start_codon:yes stop_codon:yes gene_type:complete